MMKRMKKVVALLLSFTLTLACMCNITFATALTADFDIDPELWKCIVETNVFNYDDNNDGVITKEEFGSAYGIQIDCEGYDIKDWSALQYGSEWQMVSIRNCTGGDFSVLAELPVLNNLNIAGVDDYKKISGLDKLTGLSHLILSTKTEVDFNDFVSMTSLVSMNLSAPKFKGYDALAKYEKLTTISLGGESVEGIESIPELSRVHILGLSFLDLDDSVMSDIAKKFPNMNRITVNKSAITSLDWLLEFDKLSLEHVYVTENKITDIDALIEIMETEDNRLSQVHIDGNPLSEESRIKIIESFLKCEPLIKGTVGKTISLYEPNEPFIDLANYVYLNVESADSSVAEVVGENLDLKKLGNTKLKFKYDDLEFEYDVIVEQPAGEIELNEEIISMAGLGNTHNYIFTPEVDGKYAFKVETNTGHIQSAPVYLSIFDTKYNLLSSSTDWSRSETIYYDMVAGESYYLHYISYGGDVLGEAVATVYLVENTTDELLKTDGFPINKELLKAISSPYTYNYLTLSGLDSNEDGILTFEEIENVTHLVLYCKDCKIEYWSGLEYFKNLKYLYIECANFENVSFDNFINTPIKVLALLKNCYNFKDLSGLNRPLNVEELIISSQESISCKLFLGLDNTTFLIIDAPTVTDIDSVNITNLILNTPEPTSTPLDTSNDATGITIEGGEKITAYVGDELTFKTSFTPKGTWGIVTYIVDKRNIGYFSETEFDTYGNNCSVLTLLKPGIVTVTAKSLHIRKDGTEYYLTDTIVVEVLEPTITNTPEPILKGDVNTDEKVNAEDALVILKHAAKIELIADEKSDVADVNEDTKIDAQDALEVLKIAAKITE